MALPTLTALALSALLGPAPQEAAEAGRLAILTAKVLTCADEGPAFVNNAVVLIENGLIQAVGPAAELEVPEGYEVVDIGDGWLMPGMIDLHCHAAGLSLFKTNDLNDAVFLANPGLRASASVRPGIDTLRVAVAGGVTSVLYIPGSATNIGGQGVLLKTGLLEYEDMEIRNPGSMKLAQAGNPERFLFGVGRSFMNWNTRKTVTRGMAYARNWVVGVAQGAKEHPDPQWDVFRALNEKRTQISAHTQVYQVVLMTITMMKRDLGLDVYIDHGSVGGWRAGAIAEQYGVPAIIGPRSIDTTSAVFQRVTAARLPGIRGLAAGYQSLGHTNIGFNTDSPMIPQEELQLQSALAVRYGFVDDQLQAARGLTIVPAKAAGIDHLVGSIEVGKHADLLWIDGHPADPRSAVRSVWIEGTRVYGRPGQERLW